MRARLQDKVAIVTGAASGIGAATARLFAAKGAHVFGLDRNPSPSRGDERQRHLHRRCNPMPIHWPCRARRYSTHTDVSTCWSTTPAPMCSPSRWPLSDADWDRCLSLNLKSAWNMARAVLPSMLAQGAGSIVNIASVHAHKIIPGAFPYPVAKHGLIGLTRSLGIEYAARGIRVNSISPGLILVPRIEAWFASQPDPDAARRAQTELLPPKRIGTPEEVAYTALFLASDEARFINAADILIDGGRSQLYHE